MKVSVKKEVEIGGSWIPCELIEDKTSFLTKSYHGSYVVRLESGSVITTSSKGLRDVAQVGWQVYQCGDAFPTHLRGKIVDVVNIKGHMITSVRAEDVLWGVIGKYRVATNG